MNTGQTVYEQLQEILNKCIELGRKLYGANDIKEITIDSEGFIVYGEDGGCPLEMSYHDLFSKDSGLMEFVEWRDNREGAFYYPKLLLHHYNAMSTMKLKMKVEYFIKNAIVPTK